MARPAPCIQLRIRVVGVPAQGLLIVEIGNSQRLELCRVRCGHLAATEGLQAVESAAAPGTANAYTFNVDSFAMFKLKDTGAQKAQGDLAAAIMGTEFQEVFNLNKGSIPVRLNMSMAKFDDCAKTSSKDFVDTAKTGGLVPSVAHGMAIKPAAEGAIKDAVSQFWNDDKISVADGMKNIAKAAATK